MGFSHQRSISVVPATAFMILHYDPYPDTIRCSSLLPTVSIKNAVRFTFSSALAHRGSIGECELLLSQAAVYDFHPKGFKPRNALQLFHLKLLNVLFQLVARL